MTRVPENHYEVGWPTQDRLGAQLIRAGVAWMDAGYQTLLSHDPLQEVAELKVLGSEKARVSLLADSSATGGALSTVRVNLERRADGVRPHRHNHSAEMFYILGGVVDVLAGSDIVRAEHGDVIVVPPRMPHAFSALQVHDAELLIVIAPGVERFEYFRHLTRIARGEQPPESLLDVKDLYDTWFLNSPEWGAPQKLRCLGVKWQLAEASIHGRTAMVDSRTL